MKVNFPRVGNILAAVKRIIPMFWCLLACGCADKRVDELLTRVNEQDAKIAQLEKDASSKAAQLRTQEAKIAEVQKYARQVGTSQKEGLRLQRSHQQQIDAVRDDLAELQQKSFTPLVPVAATAPLNTVAATPTPAYTAPISVYVPPNPQSSEFIQPPSGAAPDLFPVVVSEVRSVKFVSGSYTTMQTVVTDETYEDDFGQTQFRTKLEEVAVPEYDYQVSYVVQNLTRNPKELNVGAGRKNKLVAIPGGETVTNVIESAMGADLTVRIGGTVRRFPVSYEE